LAGPRASAARTFAGHVLALAAIAVMQLHGFFWQLPGFHSERIPQSASAIPGIERRLGIIGTTSIGEYAPKTVAAWPNADATLNAFVRAPAPALVREDNRRPLRVDATVQTPADTDVIVSQFYFEGWRAQVDGRDVAIKVTQPEGLISVAVPSGSHQLSVWFGSTPLREAANTVSAIALVVMLICLVLKAHADARIDDYGTALARPAGAWVAGATALVLAFGLYKHIAVDTGVNLWRESSQALRDAAPLATFAGDVQLLNNARALFDPGANHVDVTLYWRAAREGISDYSLNVRVIDAVGEPIAGVDREHPDGAYPTSRLTISDTVRDSHRLTLPPGTPPGKYNVVVGLYPFGAAASRSRSEAGAIDVIATTVVVARPMSGATPLDPAGVEIAQRVNAALAEGVTLRGLTLPLKRVRVGEAMPLTLLWQATAGGRSANEACFELRQFKGGVTPLGCRPLIAEWSEGDVWKIPYRLTLKPQLEPGLYTLSVRVGRGDVELGDIDIEAPPRVFTPPPAQALQTLTWSDAGEIVGFTLPLSVAPGESIQLELIWRATRETERKYTVFAQLVDADGDRKAGHDSQPDDGAQPTSTWLPGTYIRDVHTIIVPNDLPPGRYRINVGLYDAFSQQRLTLTDGTTQAQLNQALDVR
jgi:hypothetical protein